MFRYLVRLPLRFVPRNVAIPILTGPSRGLKWITNSGTHGCWLGTYERERQQRLLEVLHSGDCFLDIGANVGFYSLLASRIVGAAGQVHAFEPFPRNVEFLQRHVGRNNLANVTIQATALSFGADRTMHFATSLNPSSGHLSPPTAMGSSIEVPVTSLDTLWSRRSFPRPAVMKIDVEGAEFDVLQGGEQMIRDCQPTILLAGHGTAVQSQCCDWLTALRYRIEIDRDGSVDGMYESTAWPDADLRRLHD